MKWFKHLESVPLTVFGFYFVVLHSVFYRTLSYEVVAALLGIAAVHYLFQFTQVKHTQTEWMKKVHDASEKLHAELLNQRTDISKLNLLFGSLQNRSNPFRPNVQNESSFDADFKIPKPTNSPGKST